LFSTQSQLLARIRSAAAVVTYDRRFQYLAKLPLLIIDDFELKPLCSPDDEDLHDLITERYERTATILTSDLDFPERGEAFPGNKMIGAATLDRLRHGTHKIVLDGESYRGLKPGVESPKTELAKVGQIKQP
jgi:DNA replication protein DnaC